MTDNGTPLRDETPTPTPAAPSRHDEVGATAGPTNLVRIGVLGLGGILACRRLIPLLAGSPPALTLSQKFETGLDAAAVLGAFVLAALVGGWLVAAVGKVLAALNAQAAAVDRLCDLLPQVLSEGLAKSVGPPAPPDPSGLKARRLAEIRQAIRSATWDDAAALVRSFHEAHPDDPDSGAVAEELAGARAGAGRELISRIGAAREANDPDRVIELRDEVKPLLASETLSALDRDLAKWFMMLIHRRLRSGTVRSDVALLAGRVAASLDETPEGASLRASLPTLRRAAGLCPRCAQPYLGVADACPACLAGGPAQAKASGFLPEPDEAEDGDTPDDPENRPGVLDFSAPG